MHVWQTAQQKSKFLATDPLDTLVPFLGIWKADTRAFKWQNQISFRSMELGTQCSDRGNMSSNNTQLFLSFYIFVCETERQEAKVLWRTELHFLVFFRNEETEACQSLSIFQKRCIRGMEMNSRQSESPLESNVSITKMSCSLDWGPQPSVHLPNRGQGDSPSDGTHHQEPWQDSDTVSPT